MFKTQTAVDPLDDPETIVAMMRLVAPDWIFLMIQSGNRFELRAWRTGLDGSNYSPSMNACDWTIKFVRDLGREPTVDFLQKIETVIREQRERMPEEVKAMLALVPHAPAVNRLNKPNGQLFYRLYRSQVMPKDATLPPPAKPHPQGPDNCWVAELELDATLEEWVAAVSALTAEPVQPAGESNG